MTNNNYSAYLALAVNSGCVQEASKFMLNEILSL